MKVRREVLKTQTIILLAGVMAIVGGSISGASAEEKPADNGWYFHGGFDVGGRAYIERPGSGFGYNADGSFLLPKQAESRAKFEKFGEIPPGAFLDWIFLDVGTNDGRYRYNFLGKDVGYNAQSYNFDFSEAGRQYLNLSWDQIQHLYSTSAKSLFSGVGGTNLVVNDAVQALLQAQLAAGQGNRIAMYGIVNSNATHIDEIGLERDKFSASYRYTPTPDWDFNVGYAHEDRTGTKPGTLDWGYTNSGPTGSNPTGAPGFPSNVISVPVPVNDTTHSPTGSGEYVGSGPLGRYNVKLAYAGSFYRDHLTSFDADNPFCVTCNMTAPFLPGVDAGPNVLRDGLPPSNSANAFTASGATDLPFFKSRFATTNQYSIRQQNDPFVQSPYAAALGAGALPATSLNGEVTTFLTNNVLTSSLSDNLHNKLRFRYYNYDNNTTPLDFVNVVFADTEINAGGTPEYLSYKKTNINEDLTWNPWRWLTLGAGYGFEHWHRSNRFTTQTDEHVASTFATVQLIDWAQWRASYSYGWRRYDGEYEIDESTWLNSRMFDLANRNQQRARTLVDINITDAVTITPNAGLRWTDYPEVTPDQTGVLHDHSWNAGVDVGVVLSPTFRVMAGYNYERVKLSMAAVVPDSAGAAAGNACGFPGYPPPNFDPYTAPALCGWTDTLTQTFHTFVASADWKAIPDKLDFRVNYAASWSREKHDFTPCSLDTGASNGQRNCNGVAISGATGDQVGLPWPDNTSLYQRLDVVGRYHFDKETLERMGWRGQVIAKLRYTYQRNDSAFWQSDALNAYFGTISGTTELTGASRSTWLAYNNPNYTVQLIAASLVVKW
jgi:MtrB/PioB family decaheme-associated outer membrane protein